MRPLALTIDGVLGKGSEVYDFTTKTANLVAVISKDIDTLKELFSLGFYGGEQVGKLMLTYEYNGEEFVVTRDFDKNTAEVSYKGGSVINSDTEEVNKYILSQIKIEKKAFDVLAVIDRDKIYDGFMLPAYEREAFVEGTMNYLMRDKEEITSIEARIKQKYDKLTVRIEASEEVDPNELADLKTEISEKTLLRQQAKEDISKLIEAIRKGETAKNAAAELLKAEAELKVAKNNQENIDRLSSAIENSNEAEFIISLVKKKQQISEKGVEFKQKIQLLENNIAAYKRDLKNGDKTIKQFEDILIHCLERNDELRKLLYSKVEKLDNKEDAEDMIRSKVESYYAGEYEELAILNARSGELNEEYQATSSAIIEIEKRLSEIKRTASQKRAIREGAILETEINKLSDVIIAANLNVEVFNKKLSAIVPEIRELNDKINNDKLGLLGAGKAVTGGYNSKEEAANHNMVDMQTLYKSHILVVSQEQDIEAIEKKIDENIAGISNYNEDVEALNNAREGLFAYFDKVKIKEARIDSDIIEAKAAYQCVSSFGELEYGERCPVCKGVVLGKGNFEKDADKQKKNLDKLFAEKSKISDMLKDYEEKFAKINTRTGELSARIKISEAYIGSLKETVVAKKQVIESIFRDNGVSSSFELAEKLKAAINSTNGLKDSISKFDGLAASIKVSEERRALLTGERKRIEEEELPRELEKQKTAKEKLRQCEEAYNAFKEELGGVTATERLGELTLIEKEADTLEGNLRAKKSKWKELFDEKEKLSAIIPVITNKRRNIIINGKDYDYQQIVMKTVAAAILELVEEIRKSEAETEEMKVELAAVRRVYNRIKDQYNRDTSELEVLKSKIEADEDVINGIMSDFEGRLALLNINTTKDLERLILPEDKKQNMKSEIALNNDKIAIYTSEIGKLEKIVTENGSFSENLENNKASYKQLEEMIENLGQEISNTTAKRSELKSKAKQLISMKEKATRYNEKINSLGDIYHLLSENGDMPQYIVKLASKRIYSLSKGKYNLDIIDGELQLINNSKSNKTVKRDSYSKQEKLLMSLVLGTAFHRTLIDMIGGETYMLMFPLREKEADKDAATALAAYAKKTVLMVVAEDKEILGELGKVIL